MTILMAIVLAAGPLLLVLFRIGLSESASEALDLIPWVGRALVTGGLGALAFAALPLAASAMAGRRTIALGVWGAYYVVVLSIVVNIAQVTWKPLAALHPAVSVRSLAYGLWDIDFLRGDTEHVSITAAVVSLVAQTALAVFLFHRQIARTAAGAVGGSS
jgi:hypothetical protein